MEIDDDSLEKWNWRVGTSPEVNVMCGDIGNSILNSAPVHLIIFT